MPKIIYIVFENRLDDWKMLSAYLSKEKADAEVEDLRRKGFTKIGFGIDEVELKD
jgi:hypothetical protein